MNSTLTGLEVELNPSEQFKFEANKSQETNDSKAGQSSCIKGTFPLTRSSGEVVTTLWSGFGGYSVFMLCVSITQGGGGTVAGVRGGSTGMGPGAIFPFRPAER